jgi:acyl-coenzyme A thioesterase PaaI-like protein
MSVAEGSVNQPGHVAHDLGWEVQRDGDGLVGLGPVVPEMCVPGTEHLRLSILALWADILAGLLAVDVVRPRVPVTLELDVHVFRPPPGHGSVRGTGRVRKAGRSVTVSSIEFATGEGEPIGFAGASFMASPDRSLQFRQGWQGAVDLPVPEGTRLRVPYAERAGLSRPSPGKAVLPYSPDVLNAAGTINGGLVALAVEDAALSCDAGRMPGGTLSFLGLRYLQPARVGPVVATASVRDGLGLVEARDHGQDDRLCVTATTRSFAPAN